MSGFKPYDASSSGGGGGGGGGVFQAEQRFAAEIGTGQQGDLLTVTAPAGKTIKITSLFTNSNSAQSGISLVVNGNTLVDQKILHDKTPALEDTNNFGIGQLGDAPFYVGWTMLAEVYCTSFIINKNSGDTSRSISYAYEIGEVK